MMLKIDLVNTGGPENRYSVAVEHNGHTAEIEVSPTQIIRRFPELIEEINIKQSIDLEAKQRSGLMVPMPMPRGKG